VRQLLILHVAKKVDERLKLQVDLFFTELDFGVDCILEGEVDEFFNDVESMGRRTKLVLFSCNAVHDLNNVRVLRKRAKIVLLLILRGGFGEHSENSQLAIVSRINNSLVP
jgi:hypothetical protein